MNSMVNKKMKLFILAIVILIMLCLVFINHYSNRLYVRIDNSIKDVIISDIPSIEEDIIADTTIKKTTKYSINLDNIDIKVKINDIYKEEYLVSVNDKINIEISNLNYKYELYYSIRNEELVTEYEYFDVNLLSSIKTPSKFNLYIKVVVNNIYKEFNLGEFNVYDIVYEHKSNTNNEVEVGTLYNEDGSIYVNDDNTEYIYDNIEINKDIVIDNILEESNEELTTENVIEDNVDLKGNIYIVEETDLTEFDITGYIFIDTEENIKLSEDILVDSNVYSITIKNNNFMINDENYYYEYSESEIIINNLENNVINIKDIISNSKTELNENNELTIIKDENDSSFNLIENCKSNLLRL